MTRGLRIGQLAEKVGISTKTIRYYEQIGFLPKVPRDHSGYRLYPETEVPRMRLISRAKLLGLSLTEIKEIVGYISDGHCDTVQSRLFALIGEKLDEIDAKIAELALLKADLLLYQNQVGQPGPTGEQPIGGRGVADCVCIGEQNAPVLPQASTRP